MFFCVFLHSPHNFCFFPVSIPLFFCTASEYGYGSSKQKKTAANPKASSSPNKPVPFYNLYISSCGVSKSRSFPSSRFSIFKQYSYLLSIKFSAPCLFLSIIPMAVKIVKNSDKSCLMYRFLIIDLICYIHACR